MNKKITAVIVVVVAAVLLAAVALSGLNLNLTSQAASGKTVVQTAQDNGNFTKLVEALNTSGLTETLNGTGPYTVFAPTDTAFDEMNQTQLNNLTQDNASLAKLLTYHVVPGKIMSSQLNDNMTVKTLEGSDLVIIMNQTGAYVNGAKIVTKDVEASNGVIHVIDKVLVPQTIVEIANQTEDLSTLLTAVDKANLTDALNGTGPFTVFAPNNAAFDELDQATLGALLEDEENLSQLLTYHVVPYRIVAGNNTENTTVTTLQGEKLVLRVNETGVFVNNASVVQANIIGTNGVVHIIDKVLMPPMSIAETVAGMENLSALAGALDQANLTDTLNGTGPFTVFAPTNAAFEALGEMAPQDVENLTKVLTYHVLSGEVFSWQLSNTTVTMLNGQQLEVVVNMTEDGARTITVGNATVIMSDILCTNGVIHVIDAVLVPDMEAPAPELAPAPSVPAPGQPAPAPVQPDC